MPERFADSDQFAPDATEILRLANLARAALPDKVRDAAAEVALVIEELADADLCDELEIDDPFELTGLYEGIPLTEKSLADQPLSPDRIVLFRRAILDEWVARGDVSLNHLVAHVLVHEFAHHFGWSDDDIAQIDRWWE
ncbi:metallopeptidase family protein [Paracoccus sp. p4-l81]|uniref:metallopeptidase family protein n=1 Tax=unclassified Paracoccus (in: a-proteobacteria) TaxID=2688777 RepID=UPI0035B9E044